MGLELYVDRLIEEEAHSAVIVVVGPITDFLSFFLAAARIVAKEHEACYEWATLERGILGS